MAIQSTEAFLDVLSKSKLLPDPEMERVRAASAGHEDAKSLAKALVADKTLTRWQAAQLLAGRASFMLGKYRLVQLLSRGGMGSVFVAEHTTMSRRVALKIISKQMGRDPAKLDRFLEEARTIAAFDHTNIVRAYDIDHEGDRYFLVMEYVEGRDLQQLVEEDGPLDCALAADYIRQAACGLAHAHERNMIHRDVKPANLILSRQNVVKILDLGMARLIAQGASDGNADEKIIGTVDYMSPEQALESENLDHRADIYSLGCTFYFLMTGRPPFGEGTLPQRIMKHQTQDPPPISQYRSGTPEALEAICRRMMAKKPEDRYQTAAEVAQALAPWSAGSSEAAPGGEGSAAASLSDGSKTPEVETGIKIVVADSGSFRARTASSRGRRAAIAGEDASASKIGRKPAGWLAGFLADPMRKWITVLSGVLLLGLVGGGLFWMLGGENTKASADASAAAKGNSPAAGPATPAKRTIPADDSELGSGLEGLDSAFRSAKGSSSRSDKPPAGAPHPSTDQAHAAAPGGAKDRAPPAAPAKEPDSKGQGTKSVAGGAQPGPKKPADEQIAAPGAETPGSQTAPGGAEKVEKPAAAEPAETKTPAKPPSEGDKKEHKTPKPKQAADEDPLADFPDAVDLPVLAENDPPGEKSRVSLELGTIRPTGGAWQMILIGGDTALRGERKYVLAQTSSDQARETWAIHLESSGAGADLAQTPVARLWRNENALMFQWDDKAQAITANYLRNCLLQPRVGGKTKVTALTQPIKADPLKIDLLRGMSNSAAALKWAPDEERLRIKFDGVDGWEGAKFDPSEPVPPKTRVNLTFLRKDRHGNDSVGAAFQIVVSSRKTSTTVELRLVNPEPRAFKMIVGNSNEQQVGVARDRLANRRGDVERSLTRLKGEEANKANREIDALEMQIWYLDLLLQVQNKAMLHYKIVTDAGGQELVLVTTR